MSQTRVWTSTTRWGPRTEQLALRMLAPFTGLSGGVGFVAPGRRDPRIAIAGGEMTGVHVLQDRAASRPGAYHIGGTGLGREEAILKSLGETAERYSHVVALRDGHLRVTHRSLRGMRSSGEPFLCVRDLAYYSQEQHARAGFPFHSIDHDTPFGWLGVASLPGMESVWIPAQEAVIGYTLRQGEPRFTGAVSTGSAAHTSVDRALKNALLELVQIDAAMGHWYGNGESVRITRGPRTSVVDGIVDRTLPAGGPRVAFYWLPSPDLPGFPVACVVESDELPRLAVGLGCDLRLARAMYNAYLEGVAVAQLAKVLLFRAAVESTPESAGGFYDLDTNVAHYARAGGSAAASRWKPDRSIAPGDIPPDVPGDARENVRCLVGAFAECGKHLALVDLTTPDLSDLGFCSLRVWSPETLPLCLPDAPPALHERFAAYGGFRDGPFHPYP